MALEFVDGDADVTSGLARIERHLKRVNFATPYNPNR